MHSRHTIMVKTEVAVKMHKPIGQVRVQGSIARERETSEISGNVETHHTNAKNATVATDPIDVAITS